MTKDKIRLQAKLTALNKILALYNPHALENGIGLRHNTWEDESWAEQRDQHVRRIVSALRNDLHKIKTDKP